MKKKLVPVLAAMLSFAFVLTSCGTGGGSAPAASASTSAETAATESAAATDNDDAAATDNAATDTAATADATSAGGKNLTVELGPNPESIDPAINSAVDGANYILFAYEGLLGLDKDNKIIPGLAETWEESDDGLTWTFHLRDGLKWSDGSPLTASDFVYSWKRIADPNTAAPYAATVLGPVAGFDEANSGTPDALQVAAPDDKTFVVTLSAPCPYFESLAAFPTLVPVQQATITANGDAWATQPSTYICDGPFYVSDWVPSSYITFTKNPNYWNASAVKLDSIKCLLIEDTNATYAAYTNGEALMVKDLPTEEISTLKKSDEFHLDPLMGTYYISLQTQKEPFNNPKVREALSLAIDRKYVADTIMEGTYTAAPNYIGPGISDWDGTDFYDNANGGKPYIDLDDYDGNLAKAKQLLSDAGYPDGGGITFTYSTNDAGYHKVLAEYLQQAWAQLGITMNVDIVEWASFTPLRRTGDYEAARNGWVADYNDPSTLLDLLVTGNGNNDGQYSNPDYDAVMEKSRSEMDPKTRFGYLHQAEDMMMADAACIPVAYYMDYYMIKPQVTGWWHSPYGFWYFQFADLA